MREYNQFWVDNVAYLDIPDKNVEKISYYRTWENRFNTFDGNIPGNDYQFPVDLEGALGYNNQISLTVPMRMQDLQFWRDPLYSYGPWLSQGEESGCQAFHDNPGNTGELEQHLRAVDRRAGLAELPGARRPEVDRGDNLAKYSECDVKGTLAKFDTNHNNLIEYSSGTLPGNDADSVAFKYYGTRPQDRTESLVLVLRREGGGRGVRTARQHGQGRRDERDRRQHQELDPHQPVGRRPGDQRADTGGGRRPARASPARSATR